MPFGTITSTESTFGSISGDINGIVAGTISGSVGVPGPQGSTGPTGPQGPAGEGVPTGGSAGMVLAKVDEVDYNTEWVNVDLSAKRDLTDYDFTNVYDTRLNTFGLTIQPAGTTIPYDSFLDDYRLRFSYDGSNGGTVEGVQTFSEYRDDSFQLKRQDYWVNVDGIPVATLNYGALFSPSTGLKFINWDGTTQSGTVQYGRTGITFGNGSVQTIAFPGFANAALTGNPTAPTAALADNDTSIATTAFVQQELASGTAIAKNLEVQVRNQSGSTITAGSIVYLSGATGNLPLITKAQANNDANSAQTIGFVKTSIANNGMGYVIVRGVLDSIDTSALTEGVQLYLSPSTAGAWTTTKPYAPSHLVYVGIVTRSHPTLGTIVVAVQNGYELDEIHNVSAQTPSNNDLLAYETSTSLWKNTSFSTLGLLTSASAASTYQTQAGMSSYLTTASASSTYLAKSDNLASLTSASTARTNLGLGTMATATASNYSTTTVANGLYYPLSANPAGYLTSAPVTSVAGRTGAVTLAVADVSGAAPLASPSFSGTPLAPSPSVNTNSTQIATTSFVRDMLIDCAWSVPPITTTTTVTSGTGASYVNASPDYGYLVGPNVNLAGFSQKNFQMFARSNSTYGFNLTKNIKVGCKIATNWSGTFTAITQTLFFRINTGTTNGTLSQIGFGISINMATKALSILAHNGTTLTTKATSWAVPYSGIASVDFMVESDGAGTVYAYADGVLIDSTTGMSTASNTTGTTTAFAQVEVNSAGGTSTANATTYVSNLRAFVAHG